MQCSFSSRLLNYKIYNNEPASMFSIIGGVGLETAGQWLVYCYKYIFKITWVIYVTRQDKTWKKSPVQKQKEFGPSEKNYSSYCVF